MFSPTHWCILICIVVATNGLPLKARAPSKQKSTNKRISVQSKVGGNHAKGPASGNIQSTSIGGFPQLMPFPIIPFNIKYPWGIPQDGKKPKPQQQQQGGRDKEEEDVEDEEEEEEKQYKVQQQNLKEGNNGPALRESRKEKTDAFEEKNDDSEETDNDTEENEEYEDEESSEASGETKENGEEEVQGALEESDSNETKEEENLSKDSTSTNKISKKKAYSKQRRWVEYADDLYVQNGIPQYFVDQNGGTWEEDIPHIIKARDVDEDEEPDEDVAHNIRPRDAGDGML